MIINGPLKWTEVLYGSLQLDIYSQIQVPGVKSGDNSSPHNQRNLNNIIKSWLIVSERPLWSYSIWQDQICYLSHLIHVYLVMECAIGLSR